MTLITLIIIQAILLFAPESIDDVVEHQRFKVEIFHNGKKNVFYCQDYVRDRITGSNTLLLIDYTGEPSHEVVVSESMFIVLKKNPGYMPQLFEKEEKKEIKNKETKTLV